MPNLHVRDVPVEVLLSLKLTAFEEGRSLNKHVVAVLEEATAEKERPIEEVLAEIDELAKRINLPPDAPMPEDLIRHDRDTR